MSDNWKFDPSDFDTDESTDTGESSGLPLSGSNLGSGLFLLPISIIAVYAFVAKGAVLAAVEGIIGAGALALAITHAFWIGGVIVAATVAVIGILTVLNLLAAVVKRSPVNAVLGVLGLLYLGAGWAGATFLFSGVPFLVGFILTTNLLIYAGLILMFLGMGLAITVLA